jgi:hypothetical protein
MRTVMATPIPTRHRLLKRPQRASTLLWWLAGLGFASLRVPDWCGTPCLARGGIPSQTCGSSLQVRRLESQGLLEFACSGGIGVELNRASLPAGPESHCW